MPWASGASTTTAPEGPPDPPPDPHCPIRSLPVTNCLLTSIAAAHCPPVELNCSTPAQAGRCQPNGKRHSESRVRENRSHGSMRGGSRRSLAFGLSIRRLPPTLLGAMSHILRIKRVLMAGGIILAAYFGLYFLNAAFGGYDPYYTSDGRSRYEGSLLMHDCIMWQPRFGSYYNEYRHDFGGIAFYPLLQLDHRYIHKTHSVADDDFPKWWESLAVTGIHTKCRNDYTRWKTVEAKYKPQLEAARARGDEAEAERIRSLIRAESDGVLTNK
jgi:hypothetical protein